MNSEKIFLSTAFAISAQNYAIDNLRQIWEKNLREDWPNLGNDYQIQLGE